MKTLRILILALVASLLACSGCGKKSGQQSNQSGMHLPGTAGAVTVSEVFIGTYATPGDLTSAGAPASSPQTIAKITSTGGYYMWVATDTSGPDGTMVIQVPGVTNGRWRLLGTMVGGPGQPPTPTLLVSTFASLPVANAFGDGVMAFVTAQRALYVTEFRSNNEAWVRQPTGQDAWKEQTVWHINPSTGNDGANDCNTVSTPCATLREVQLRLSPSTANVATIPLSTNVDIFFDVASISENINFSANVPGTSRLVIHGLKTVVSTSAFTAFTSRAGATNTPNSGTDATQNWTTQLGRLITDTTSVLAPSAFVVKNNGANVGRFSTFLAFDPAVNAFGPIEVAPGATDAYTVSTLTTFSGEVNFNFSGSNDVLAGVGKVVIDGVEFTPVGNRNTTILSQGINVYLTNSIVDSTLLVNSVANRFINVLFSASGSYNTLYDSAGGASMWGGCQTGGSFSPFSVGYLLLRSGFLVQGGALIPAGSTQVEILDTGIMDGPTGGQAITQRGATITLSGTAALWGSGGAAVSNPLSAAEGYFYNNSGTTWVLSVPLTASSANLLSAGITSTYAFDPATGAYTAARNLTLALLDATIAGGGFVGSYQNPRAPSGFITTH